MSSRLKRFLLELGSFPGQFWVLTLGILIYVAAAALAFPFEGIYLHRELGVSMSMVGVVFGLVPVAVMPMQFWGGHLTDRLDRRLPGDDPRVHLADRANTHLEDPHVPTHFASCPPVPGTAEQESHPAGRLIFSSLTEKLNDSQGIYIQQVSLVTGSKLLAVDFAARRR